MFLHYTLQSIMEGIAWLRKTVCIVLEYNLVYLVAICQIGPILERKTE